jgi:hypothetical protein
MWSDSLKLHKELCECHTSPENGDFYWEDCREAPPRFEPMLPEPRCCLARRQSTGEHPRAPSYSTISPTTSNSKKSGKNLRKHDVNISYWGEYKCLLVLFSSLLLLFLDNFSLFQFIERSYHSKLFYFRPSTSYTALKCISIQLDAKHTRTNCFGIHETSSSCFLVFSDFNLFFLFPLHTQKSCGKFRSRIE